MAVTVNDYGSVSVLVTTEELIGESVDVFLSRAIRCLESGRHELVVDCQALGQIDSAGLEALLEILNRCEVELGTVKLCSLDHTIAKVLEITRLARRFEVFADLESAVKSFS